MPRWITMPTGTHNFCLAGCTERIPDDDTARSLVIRILTQAPVAIETLPYAAAPCLLIRADGSHVWIGIQGGADQMEALQGAHELPQQPVLHRLN